MVGVVFYHKNVKSLYKDRWIQKCIKSMLHQDFLQFKIYELNYGEDEVSLIKRSKTKRKYDFYSQSFDNHADAMNFIIGKAFDDGCDYVFNTNIDDYYDKSRISKQIKFLEEGYDLVSSDFCYVEEVDDDDVITFYKNIYTEYIKESIDIGHNVIAHPSVAYSKNFWKNYRYIPEQIPMEDLLLWKRALDGGCKMKIVEDVLLFYRLHKNQITGDNSSQLQEQPQIPEIELGITPEIEEKEVQGSNGEQENLHQDDTEAPNIKEQSGPMPSNPEPGFFSIPNPTRSDKRPPLKDLTYEF